MDSPRAYKQPSLRLAWLCDTELVQTVHEDSLLVQKRSGVLSEGFEAGDYDIDLSDDPVFLGVAEGRSDPHILDFIASAIFSTEAASTDEKLRSIMRGEHQDGSEVSNRRLSLRDMKVTLTAALVYVRQVTIALVDDTRCYRYRDGKVTKVTTDPSLVAQLIEECA